MGIGELGSVSGLDVVQQRTNVVADGSPIAGDRGKLLQLPLPVCRRVERASSNELRHESKQESLAHESQKEHVEKMRTF